jgi:hypothetical protein
MSDAMSDGTKDGAKDGASDVVNNKPYHGERTPTMAAKQSEELVTTARVPVVNLPVPYEAGAAAPALSGGEDPEAILAEPPDSRDISAELAEPPRRKLPFLSMLLFAGMIAGLGFAGGAYYEKQNGTSTSAGAALSRTGGAPGGFSAEGGAGGGFGGGAPGGTGTTGGGTASVDPDTGQTVAADGSTSGGTTTGTTGTGTTGTVALAQPVTVAGSSGWGGAQTLMLLAGIAILALVLLPSFVSRLLARRSR